MLAARGARETDAGAAPLGDDALAATLRRRALHVWLLAATATMLLTAAAWLLSA